MSQLDFSKSLNKLSAIETAHGSGKKYVFRTNEQMKNSSTQIAYGVFKPGEVCETHIHPTMYEYFFFIKGVGTYIIGEQKVDLQPNTFLEIPPGVQHSLHADKGKTLEFVYWGIATD